MKTTKRLSIAVAVALLVGCNSSPAPQPAPGDFAPHVTFSAPARPVSRGLVQVSTPQSSRERFVPRLDLPVVTEQDSVLRVPAGKPGTYLLPVDAVSADSFLYLIVHSNVQSEVDAALADITVTSPTGEVLNRRAPIKGTTPDTKLPDQTPMPTVPLEGKPTGDYVLQVGPGAAKYDLTFKAQQPVSAVALSLKPSTQELLLGNDASVEVTLVEDGKPIPAASVHGHLVDPAMGKNVAVTFASVGNGVWRASGLGAAFAESSAAGMWHVFVEADGKTPAGVAFRRFASTAFDFAVPTAQITDATATRVVKDAAGKITGFEVDVTVVSRATDRYEVSALITTMGSDGQEHPLVRAQTADVIDPGTSRLTLHFDAGYAQLAGLEGDYLVRDLMLYSQGVNAPMQRALAGSTARFQAVRLADLAPPTDIPPRVLEMQRRGLL